MNASPAGAFAREVSAPCIGNVRLGNIPRVVLGVSEDESSLAAISE